MRIKERCSALGHLMVGAELGGALIPLGVTDQKRLDQCLQAKENGKLTPAMERDLAVIIEKRDTPFKPELSVGAKTHVQNKWYGQKYDYQKRFSNKYTRKGNEREQDAIRQVAKYLGYNPDFAFKNETHLENDFIHGTFDWGLPIFTTDTKCVWQPSGLDFFNAKVDPMNEWQGKGYSYLREIPNFLIAKILMNPPETMIYSLAKPLWEEAGYHWSEPITDEFLADVKHEYDFEAKNPIEDRIRLIRVDFTNKDQLLIEQQVNLMNEYWLTLNEQFSQRNKAEFEFFKKKTIK